MARAEAPRTLNEPSSQAYLLQFLREQAIRNGDVIDGNDPYRQVGILLKNQASRKAVRENVIFSQVERTFEPTPEDLIGK